MTTAMPTFGQEWALYTTGMRAKYGCWPVPEGTPPREGYEDFPLAPKPEWDDLPQIQKAMTPLNRADYRQRLRKKMESRDMRLSTYTRLRLLRKPWESDMK